MTRMRLLILAICSIAFANQCLAHGFLISENDSAGIPVSLSAASQSQVLDSTNTASPYANLFWDTFPNTTTPDSLFTEGTSVSTPRSSPGTYYPTNDGGVSTSGPFGFYDSATFRIVSPLLFSNGGAAVPAAAGVSLNVVERFPSNAPNGASNATNHPGAANTANGLISISGNKSSVQGFQISLADTHELAKDLILGGSTQTGEYGFAYTVSVQYHNGPLLTTGPLIDIYSLTDPTLSGGSFTNASAAVQDAATLAIYTTAVPEPSSILLASLAIIAFCIVLRASRWHKQTS